MKVYWTHRAVEHLLAIYEYIAKDSEIFARRSEKTMFQKLDGVFNFLGFASGILDTPLSWLGSAMGVFISSGSGAMEPVKKQKAPDDLYQPALFKLTNPPGIHYLTRVTFCVIMVCSFCNRTR
jgi:hypothetical protein